MHYQMAGNLARWKPIMFQLLLIVQEQLEVVEVIV